MPAISDPLRFKPLLHKGAVLAFHAHGDEDLDAVESDLASKANGMPYPINFYRGYTQDFGLPTLATNNKVLVAVTGTADNEKFQQLKGEYDYFMKRNRMDAYNALRSINDEAGKTDLNQYHPVSATWQQKEAATPQWKATIENAKYKFAEFLRYGNTDRNSDTSLKQGIQAILPAQDYLNAKDSKRELDITCGDYKDGLPSDYVAPDEE